MRRLSLVMLFVASCGDGSATADDGCQGGEVQRDGRCVRLCNADDECATGTICLDGICETGVRPEVVASSPADGATNVAADVTVVLTFSTPMEPSATASAFLLVGPSGPVAGATEWNDTNLAMTFEPAEDLTAGADYTAQLVTTAVSANGIPIADRFELAFTVFLPPVTVVGMTPTPGSSEVGINPLISVTFSVPMDPTSVRASATLFAPGSLEVAGNEMLNTDNTVWTFVPGANLAYDATYTIQVAAGAASAAGATLAEEFTGAFSTTAQADSGPPTVAIDAVSVVVSSPELDTFDSFTFTGTATDAETAVEQVYVQVVPAGQGPGTTWAPATLVGSDWSYRWFPRNLDPLPDGNYTLYARAVDKGANETSANEVFQADLAPPVTPSFVTTPPTEWKFTTLDFELQGEIDSSAEVRVNTTVVADSPYDLDVTGRGTVSLELTTLGTYNIAIFGIDEHGNRNDTPLLHTVEKIDYDCLTAVNGFPAPGAEVIGSVEDDGEGNITLTYELTGSYADDAFLEQYDANDNNGARDYLELEAGQTAAVFKYADLLIPSCVTITSARVSFFESYGVDSGFELEIFPLLRAWSESEVTWDDAITGEAWQTAGANGPNDAGTTIGQAEYVDDSPDRAVLDLTLTAREWLSGNMANHGVVLRLSSGNARIYSSEDNSYPPRLELVLREPD